MLTHIAYIKTLHKVPLFWSVKVFIVVYWVFINPVVIKLCVPLF